MISKLFLLISSLTLYFLCVGLVPLYRRYALARGVLDVACARSAHKGVVPRGGGVVFTTIWALVLILGWMAGIFSNEVLFCFLPGTLLVASLGYWDDNQTLPPKFRLLGQGLAAAFFLLSLLALGNGQIEIEGAGISELTGLFIPDLHIFGSTPLHFEAGFSWVSWLIWGFTLIGLIWSINLFNFMDGLDGFAGLESIFVLGTGGFIFWAAGAPELALLQWSMVALVIGFLVWNWPKAIIFMGDVGSYTLGFLIAAFAVAGDVWYNIPIALWVILYALFWVDATLTLIRRLCHKKHWAAAHNEHAYQRLYRAGVSPARILVLSGSVNAGLMVFALFGYYYSEYLGVALLVSLAWVLLWYLFCEYVHPQKRLTI